MRVPTMCHECGSKSLTWMSFNHVRVGCQVQEGRLRTNEVECMFILGCDECSETLLTRNADDITRLLNAEQEQSE